ncbi:MAG: AEC family transporter [Lachnospiraceae bacterium]|nr:AEC family transporter [Lachnospiraceae bacterium]
MILLQQMMVLFIIMMIGYLCRRIGLFGAEASKLLSGIVVNVANPALILSSSINKESTIQGKELALTMGLAISFYVVLLVLAEIIPRLLRVEERDYGVYKVMTVFSNIGFMGFPLLTAMYGNESLLYASLFLIPYNVLIYTYGVGALCKTEETVKEGKKAIPWKKIFNIGVIACIISVILYLTRLRVPQVIEDVTDTLGNLTAPLSMMVIGDAMSQMKIKELLKDKKLMIFTGIKILVIPIIGLFLVKQLGLNPMLTGVCLVMLSTPVGSMTAMLAQQYDGNYELASKGVALTTLLSVITMPIVSMITGI